MGSAPPGYDVAVLSRSVISLHCGQAVPVTLATATEEFVVELKRRCPWARIQFQVGGLLFYRP